MRSSLPICILIAFSSCVSQAGSSSSTSSSLADASCVGTQWHYMLRRSEEASYCDDAPSYAKAHFPHKFQLPDASIVRVAMYYSRFLEGQNPFSFSSLGDTVPFASSDPNDWIAIDPDRFEKILLGVGVTPWVANSLKLLLIGAQKNGYFSTFLDTLASLDIELDIQEHIEKPFEENKRRLEDMGIISHHFIVLETDDGQFHSIEKFCDYVDVRSSTNLTHIVSHQMSDDNLCNKRINPRLSQHLGWVEPYHRGITVKDLEIVLSQELNRPYQLLWDNCQHFAQRLWDHVVMDPVGKRKFMAEHEF